MNDPHSMQLSSFEDVSDVSSDTATSNSHSPNIPEHLLFAYKEICKHEAFLRKELKRVKRYRKGLRDLNTSPEYLPPSDKCEYFFEFYKYKHPLAKAAEKRKITDGKAAENRKRKRDLRHSSTKEKKKRSNANLQFTRVIRRIITYAHDYVEAKALEEGTHEASSGVLFNEKTLEATYNVFKTELKDWCKSKNITPARMSEFEDFDAFKPYYENDGVIEAFIEEMPHIMSSMKKCKMEWTSEKNCVQMCVDAMKSDINNSTESIDNEQLNQ